MATDLKSILTNTKTIYMSDSNLNSLLDYERVLDEFDLYTFKNWKIGELVEGPIYEKYFVTCKWMYPFRKMPDPSGGKRLLDYGCEISYEKDTFEYPVEVKSPDDFKPGTKTPRMVSKPVWVVTITMPKRLMSDIERGSIELENETLNAEEIDDAYEEGLDDDTGNENNKVEGNAAQPGQIPGQPPGIPPAPTL
jgi:hypothetical protein